MKKRMMALLLTTAMSMSLLVGCAGGGTQDTASDATADTTADASDATADASGAASEENVEPVELRLVLYGDTTDRKDEFFENEFHDRVLEELNIDFTVEWFPWSEMNGSTIINMLASGESFAFENITTLTDFHVKGYLAEISMEDIEANMPAYLDMRGENNGFECCKYKGDIYCIPIGNKAYSGHHQCVTVRNELLNEVGWDAADIHTYDDFMAAIAAVKEKYPDITVMRTTASLRYALSEYLGNVNTAQLTDNYCMVNENEEGDTVYSVYESEWYKNYVKMMEEWVELGYQSTDVLTNPGQGEADWYAGNALCMYGVAGHLIETNIKSTVPDADLQLIKFEDKQYVKGRDYDWGISFSANEAEKIPYWLQLINWIYQDQETYNFCVYGVEGKDWEYAENGTVTKLVDDTFWDDWFLQASQYVAYDKSIPQENIDAYSKFDDGAIPSKLIGFTFDPTNVETEKALMSAVVSEYFTAMSAGLMDFDKDYENALAKLKEAGLDKYVAEYQRQYSEWYAANH